MRTRWKAVASAIAVAVATMTVVACGSDGGSDGVTTQPPPLSGTTARHLANLSDRIADNLDAGETCSAAIAADDLKDAVGEAHMSAALRSSVDAVTGELVNEVNCPPPPPPPEPKKKKDEEKKPKDEGDGHGEEGAETHEPPGHVKHGGFVPPGHAKIGDEPE